MINDKKRKLNSIKLLIKKNYKDLNKNYKNNKK